MPYPKETVRHPITEWAEHDEKMLNEVVHGRWNPFKNEPIKDVSELFYVMRQVVNTDPSRLSIMLKLMKEHPKLIVFYNFNYELAMIRSLTSELWQGDKVAYAEWNGHKHEPIPEAGSWLYAVQYMAGAEGWNCVETNATSFWSLNYSYKLWEQAHGRIDRLNTPFKDLYYYTLRSKAAIDWAIWRSLKSKKSFQTQHFDMTNAEFANFSVKSVTKS
jgi:hypothetical protein